MEKVVIFDGLCGFCENSVKLMLKHDKKRVLKFAPAQSGAGRRLLAENGLGESPGSVVFIENGVAHLKSTATLKIAANLAPPWNLARLFLAIPAFIRDVPYRIIAMLRHRLGRRRAECMMPTAEQRAQFID